MLTCHRRRFPFSFSPSSVLDSFLLGAETLSYPSLSPTLGIPGASHHGTPYFPDLGAVGLH